MQTLILQQYFTLCGILIAAVVTAQDTTQYRHIGAFVSYQRQVPAFEWFGLRQDHILKYQESQNLQPGFYLATSKHEQTTIYGLASIQTRRQQFPLTPREGIFDLTNPPFLRMSTFHLELFYGRYWTVQRGRIDLWQVDLGFSLRPGFTRVATHSRRLQEEPLLGISISGSLHALIQLSIHLSRHLDVVGGYSMAFMRQSYTHSRIGLGQNSAISNNTLLQLFPGGSVFRLGLGYVLCSNQ